LPGHWPRSRRTGEMSREQISELVPLRRSPRELSRDTFQFEAILVLKSSLADPVLLQVVISAKADRPPIGRLEASAAVGSEPHMRTLDRRALAPRHAAMMLAHPVAMRGTAARGPGFGWTDHRMREHHPSDRLAPAPALPACGHAWAWRLLPRHSPGPFARAALPFARRTSRRAAHRRPAARG